MSKMRSISATIFGSSRYSGLFQSIGWRVGASRLPSRLLMGFAYWGDRTQLETGCALSPSVRERVERLLETVRVRPLGFRHRLEPPGHLLEPFPARALPHARLHVGVFVRLPCD